MVATFAPQYNFGKQFCVRPENSAQLERALRESIGLPIRLQLTTAENSDSSASPAEMPKPAPARKRNTEKVEHPWVKRATELFDARVVWMEDPQNQGSDANG